MQVRSRDFRLLLLGQTTSQLGAQVSGVAVPLLAVLVLGASPFELGLVGAAGTLAFALIGLPAGAWIDRMRRRPVLVAADVARAALLATIPVAAVLDLLTIGQLIVVALPTRFDSVAGTRAVESTAGCPTLPRSISSNAYGSRSAMVTGPSAWSTSSFGPPCSQRS